MHITGLRFEVLAAPLVGRRRALLLRRFGVNLAWSKKRLEGCRRCSGLLENRVSAVPVRTNALLV